MTIFDVANCMLFVCDRITSPVTAVHHHTRPLPELPNYPITQLQTPRLSVKNLGEPSYAFQRCVQ